MSISINLNKYSNAPMKMLIIPEFERRPLPFPTWESHRGRSRKAAHRTNVLDCYSCWCSVVSRRTCNYHLSIKLDIIQLFFLFCMCFTRARLCSRHRVSSRSHAIQNGETLERIETFYSFSHGYKPVLACCIKPCWMSFNICKRQRVKRLERWRGWGEKKM